MSDLFVSPNDGEAIESVGSGCVVAETGKRKVREQESALEHLLALLAAERQAYPACEDYLSSAAERLPNGEGGINEAWRRKLCEWCYEVVDHFGFDREVVSIALNFLDRAVAAKAASQSIAKKDFQLLAVTSLYIAIKTHGQTENFDGPRRKLKIEAFVQLSRGVFSVDTIEETERQILKDLKWRVNPPTNLRFISYFLRLLPTWTVNGDTRQFARAKSVLYEISRYLAELSVCVSKFSFSCTSSMVAYASILCAMEVLQENVSFPYEARVAFLKTIAESTGLFPEAPEVRLARTMIKELCPSMFEGEELPAEFQFSFTDCADAYSDDLSAGKASPVGVVNQYQGPPSKRSRTCQEETYPWTLAAQNQTTNVISLSATTYLFNHYDCPWTTFSSFGRLAQNQSLLTFPYST